MATIVCGHRVNDGVNIFYTEDRQTFRVIEFKDGVVTLDPLCGTMFEPYAKIIAGCFAPGSNFEREILKAFKAKSSTKVKGIKVVFNDIHVCTATKEEHNARAIARKYFEAIASM